MAQLRLLFYRNAPLLGVERAGAFVAFCTICVAHDQRFFARRSPRCLVGGSVISAALVFPLTCSYIL